MGGAALEELLEEIDLPQLITEYETSFYNDETGLEERALPEDRIILAPANLGDALEFRYGLSATALELIRSPQSEMTFSDGPGIVGLAVKQETGASGLQNRAGQRERTTGQVQSGFGKKTPVQKAKQQHESGRKGKDCGRPGTGGKKAE